MKKLFAAFVVSLIFSINLFSQNSIIPYLKQIENGETKKAEEFVKAAGTNHNNPDFYFLEAVITPDGETALERYMMIYDKYPDSKFADAALYRIFSYYYALGYYQKAESYLEQLKKFYPGSPYIKSADRNIPDEAIIIEEEPEAQQAAVQPTQTYNFTVQAGAFLNLDNAKKLKDNIEKDDYSCQIKTKEVGGSILNVVLVGKFATREEAQKIIDYLKVSHKLNARIASLTQYN